MLKANLRPPPTPEPSGGYGANAACDGAPPTPEGLRTHPALPGSAGTSANRVLAATHAGVRHAARLHDTRMVDRMFVTVARSVLPDGGVDDEIVSTWTAAAVDVEPVPAASSLEREPTDPGTDAWDEGSSWDIQGPEGGAADAGPVDACGAAASAELQADPAQPMAAEGDRCPALTDGEPLPLAAGDVPVKPVGAVAAVTPSMGAAAARARGASRRAMSTIGAGLVIAALLIAAAALLRAIAWTPEAEAPPAAEHQRPTAPAAPRP